MTKLHANGKMLGLNVKFRRWMKLKRKKSKFQRIKICRICQRRNQSRWKNSKIELSVSRNKRWLTSGSNPPTEQSSLQRTQILSTTQHSYDQRRFKVRWLSMMLKKILKLKLGIMFLQSWNKNAKSPLKMHELMNWTLMRMNKKGSND